MKKNVFFASLLGAVVAVAAASPSAQALTACQTSCNNQYYATVNSMWQTPHPATTTMPNYRQQVLAALDTLNKCMAACSAAVPPTPVNLAIGKTATASLSATGYEPAKVVDDSTATYWWAKSTAAQWIQVDLGAAKTLSKVTLAWGTNYATGYNVQVSIDGTTWTPIYTTTVGKGGAVEHPFTAASARYVRVNCTKASGKNGYAITELGILGN